ncbi:MAG: hypothetical protein WCR36_10980 [Bacteroidaceae bacterium]
MKFDTSNILRAVGITIILVIIFVVPRTKENYKDTSDLAKMPNQVCYDTLHVIAPRTMRVIPVWLACHLDLFEKQGLYVDLDIVKDKATCDSLAREDEAAIIITDNSEGYLLPGYSLCFPYLLCDVDLLNPQKNFSRRVFLETYNQSIKYMYSHYAEEWGYDAFKALSIPKHLYDKVSIPHFDSLSIDKSSW